MLPTKYMEYTLQIPVKNFHTKINGGGSLGFWVINDDYVIRQLSSPNGIDVSKDTLLGTRVSFTYTVDRYPSSSYLSQIIDGSLTDYSKRGLLLFVVYNEVDKKIEQIFRLTECINQWSETRTFYDGTENHYHFYFAATELCIDRSWTSSPVITAMRMIYKYYDYYNYLDSSDEGCTGGFTYYGKTLTPYHKMFGKLAKTYFDSNIRSQMCDAEIARIKQIMNTTYGISSTTPDIVCDCKTLDVAHIKRAFLGISTNALENVYIPHIENVYYLDRKTTVKWDDGTVTTVACCEGETFSKEIGLGMAIAKKYMEKSYVDHPRAEFKRLVANAHDMTAKRKKKLELKAKAKMRDELKKTSSKE